jgi:hypothetical protein
MTPIQAIKTLTRAAGARQPAQAQRPVILTRAETAPCTCPERCERDHEVD